MEKSAKSREEDGPTENVARPGPKTLKEEPQKKKKLVFFELDNRNNAQNAQFEVANIKIKELLCTTSKDWNGSRNGSGSGGDDGLNLASSGGRGALVSPRTCQFTVEPIGDVNRMIFDEFGIDLIELQNRILELEKQLKNDNLGLPAILSDLKSQVENFRNKLETAEWHRRTELQKEPFCQRFQYRRTSSERGRKIREKFLIICEKEISKSTIDWLKQPSFDSSQYEDEEILLFIQHMFLELGLVDKFGIRLPVLRNFLYEVYKNYNEVPFHNFRHCFCVAQMMYVMIWSVDIANRMGDLDTLILLTACICHDLDHPGYNNIYQINARTELALLYNDISPLENHHCSVAFRILENPDCNIFAALDKETFKEIREGIIRCILATDMARHNEILTQFKDVISEFDFSNKGHKNLLSMILIKVADISNEARPMSVAEPWLDRLLTEFFKQSDAEKQEGLPVTPFMDRDKITKPSSQCSFIGFVLLPLFEALGELLPELHDLIITPAKDALEHYRRLNEAAKDERMRRKSLADTSNLDNNEDVDGSVMVKSGSGHSVRSRRSFCNSCTQVRQRSRSSEDFEPDSTPPLSPSAFSVVVDDLENVDEREEIEIEEDVDDDELEEETVTEVEVSEKTLKFKISTEGGTSTNFPLGRKSCPGNFPGSRKGSREKNQYLENDSEWCRIMARDRDDRSLKRSMTSDTMSSGKGSSDSENRSADRTSRKGSGESEGRTEETRKWSPRQKDSQRKVMSYQGRGDHDYRRKSVAVERPRAGKGESYVRRSSLATAARTPATIVSTVSEKRRMKPETVDSVLEKLDRGCCYEEERGSREFETSCWGLQNLKIDTGSLNATAKIIKNATDSTSRKSIAAEKSKSEDNLSITAGVTSSEAEKRKSRSDVILANNMYLLKGGETGEKVSERKQGHPSILTRLKHLRDKIAFGRDADTRIVTDVAASVISSSSCPTTTRSDSGEKTGTDMKKGENECDQDFERSRTLPKARKPGRTSGGKMRRGWRALIGKSEGNSSSSSLDFPSVGSPSPVRRRDSLATEEAATRRKASAGSGGGVGGTGPCSGADKKKSMWLPSPKKTGFLGRIGGRYECDGADGSFSGRNNFLNSLTSSFRKKGTKSEEENGAGFSGSGRRDGSKPN